MILSLKKKEKKTLFLNQKSVKKPFEGEKIGLWVCSFFKVSGPIYMDGILLGGSNKYKPLSVFKENDFFI